jgi:hypothetical protein
MKNPPAMSAGAKLESCRYCDLSDQNKYWGRAAGKLIAISRASPRVAAGIVALIANRRQMAW